MTSFRNTARVASPKILFEYAPQLPWQRCASWGPGGAPASRWVTSLPGRRRSPGGSADAELLAEPVGGFDDICPIGRAVRV